MNRLPTLNTLINGSAEAAKASGRVAIFARAARALLAGGAAGADPAAAFFVPGRLEVLGKHTDYAGGRSLTCAVDRGFVIVATPRNDRSVSLRDLSSGESAMFEISSSIEPKHGSWMNYPMTVAQRLALNFDRLWRGATIAFQSDLPPAAGLSSSSAFMVATFLVLSALNDLDHDMHYRQSVPDRFFLSEYLGCMESGRTFRDLHGASGVGTRGGSEDQTAILCSEPDHLKCFSYQPIKLQQSLRLPDQYCFVITSSGVSAEKTGAAQGQYNRLAELTEKIVTAANRQSGRQFKSLADIHLADPNGYLRFQELTPQLQDRWAHFDMEENIYLPAAINALAAGEMTSFAAAINASHVSASKLLGNQIPETNDLVRLARQHGALAASAFGAGFGGSVYALVEMENANRFARDWFGAYQQAHPVAGKRAAAFITRPARAAYQIH